MAIDYSEIPDSVYDQVIHELYGTQNLKERSDHYEFVCPVCGDMRFPNKRKAWIYKDTWKYICFKCPCSMPFAAYLKQTEPETYSKLIYSAFGSMPNERKKREEPKEERPRLPANSPFMEGELIPITSNHPLAKAGLAECRSRRIRPEVFEKWLLNVPRIFLSTALKGCVKWAKENNVELITEEHMKIINDKRSKEKGGK